MLQKQTQKRDIKIAKEIAPTSLQNLTNPDATYRKIGKKKYIGYMANMIDRFDDHHRMIEDYDLQKKSTLIINLPKISLKNYLKVLLSW